MRAEVHMREVDPDEKGLARPGLGLDVSRRPPLDVVIDGFHALLGQRTGVPDLLLSIFQREAVDDASGTEPLLEVREVLRVRIVGQLRFLLGVQVVQVAEDLVMALLVLLVGILGAIAIFL